jgi:hypothetical protein
MNEDDYYCSSCFYRWVWLWCYDYVTDGSKGGKLMNENNNNSIFEVLTEALASVIAGIIILFVDAALATWLWNLIVVLVFHAPALVFWQAFGLIALVRIILNLETITFSTDTNEE